MSFGKLKPILILGLLILTPVPHGFGQTISCYDLWGPSQLPTEFMTVSGYYGVGPTAFVPGDIVSVQIALKNRGFYFGDFNGMLTMETIDAVQRFQAANNLPSNGILDARTQMALNVTIKGTAASTMAYSGFDFSACNPPAPVTQELGRPEVNVKIELKQPNTVPSTQMQMPTTIGSPKAVTVGLSDKNLQEIRKALAERGFDPGPSQGTKAEWVDAVRRFQQEYSLPVTGYLDEATLSVLNLRFEIHGPRQGTMRVSRSGRYPDGRAVTVARDKR